ncbi:hypothetical protein PLESTF_000259500 [Pleodorina starrii]|nr:hypothetical protein PLESTF_000259500 [Pleodorina starrii]
MDDVKFAVEEVEPSTAVYNAVRGCFVRSTAEREGTDGLASHQLLVNCGDYLQLWEPVDGSLALQQAFYLFERVEHMDLVPASLGLFGPDSTDAVLLFTFDGRCALFKLELQAHRDQQLPAGSACTAASSTPGPFVLTEVACLVLPVPALRDGLMPKRLGGVCSSGVAPVAKVMAMRSSARGVAVAAIHTGMLHVLTLHLCTSGADADAGAGASASGASGTSKGGASTSAGSSSGGGDGGDGDQEPLMMCAVVVIQDTPLYGMFKTFDPLYSMQHLCHVYDMCFVPPPERDAWEPPLLVVLHKADRAGAISFQIDCLALALQLTQRPGRRGGGGGGGGGEAPKPGSGAGPSMPGKTSTNPAGKGPAGAAAGAAAAAAGPSSTSCTAAAGAAAGAEDVPVLRASLKPGPWQARLVHPTTTVIAPFPAVPSAGLPAGVLAVSSRGASLYGRPPTLGPIALAAASAMNEVCAVCGGGGGPPTEAEWGDELSRLDPRDKAAAATLFGKWFGRNVVEDAAIEFAEQHGVRRYELVSYALAGMPLAAEVLAPGVVLIGDSAAGLHLIHAAGPQPWVARVAPDLSLPGHMPPHTLASMPRAMPKVLAYMPPPPPTPPEPAAAAAAAAGSAAPEVAAAEALPAAAADEALPAAGLLFLGSDCSNSQILCVPTANIAADAQPPPLTPPPTSEGKDKDDGAEQPAQPAQGEAGQQGQGDAEEGEEGEEDALPPLPLLHWPVAELAALKSLAPVTDVAVVPDSSGADDPWLIASCGRNAAGRLVRARLAAGLVPYMADGPRVPDGCRMFPLRLGPGSHGAEEAQQQGQQGQGQGQQERRGGVSGHTHIAFSFEAAGRTDLLCVGGGGGGDDGGEGGGGGGAGEEFTQVELPGLTHGSASLLVADVAGQRLVQVTQAGVRVLHPLSAGADLAAEWKSPEPLSLAALSGTLLAAASRTCLTLLGIEPATGAVSQLSAIPQLPAQLSALALWRPSSSSPSSSSASSPSASSAGAAAGGESPAAEAAATFVLMGQWLSNRVEVAAVADPCRPLLQLQLADDETPRSLALLELPGGGGAAAAPPRPPVLLAGTHTGRLLMWQLAEAPTAAAAAAAQRPWRLGPCYSLRVSQVSVELQPVPGPPAASAAAAGSGTGRPRSGGAGGGGGGGYIYLHSHSGALVRPRPQAAAGGGSAAAAAGAAAAAAAASPPPLDQLVEVVRVHGSEGLQAVCHVSTAAMPESACWVTREGRMLFGRIDPRVRLRWSTAFVGETIHAFAYHSASHCLVALTECRPSGDNSLRVIDVDSLQQVLSMRLSHGHNHTAITVGPLPCTTGRKAAAAARRAAAAAAAAGGGGGGGGSAAAAAGAATPAEKEFVVLASYLSADSSSDPEVRKHVRGARLLYGALSFMELVAVPAADGSNATSYSLLLHGTCIIPSVATSLAIARPSPYIIAAAAAAVDTERDPVNMPYLLAGCQGGVCLLQAFVDDGRHRGERAVNRALELVGQVDELNLPLPRDIVDVEARLARLEKVIEKRAAAEARAAAKAAAGGSGEGGGGGDGTEEEEEGLAEDESELPEVDSDLEAQLRQIEALEAEEAPEWRYGLGLMDQPDGEDVDYFERWAADNHIEPEPTQAPLAAKLLRRRFQREKAMMQNQSDGDGDWGSDGGSSDDDDDGSGGGGGGARHRRRRRGPSLHQLVRDLERDWSQHVTLKPLDGAKTFAGACVTSLACLGNAAAAAAGAGGGGGGGGSLVLAGDYLGSVTVMRLVANGRGAALIACSPDRSPIYVQAAAWLDPHHALVAVHPHGLAVLRRDPAAEEEAMAAAHRQAVADYEAGINRQRQNQAPERVWDAGGGQPPPPAAARRGGGGGGVAAAAGAGTGTSAGGGGGAGAAAASRFSSEDLRNLKARIQTMPGLVVEARCRVRHMVTRMCRARLGLRPQLHRHPSTSATPGSHTPLATTQTAAAATTTTTTTAAKARPGSGAGRPPPSPSPSPPQQQQTPQPHRPNHHQPPADGGDELMLCFSVSGHVAAVRLQSQWQWPSQLHPAAAAAPPLAKLARLQYAFNSLDAADTALLTGIDTDSYCHNYSWPLLVPRQTAAGAGLAGAGPAAAAAANDDEDEHVALEAEAEALAVGCVDGSVMRLLLAAAEAQLRRDAEGGGGGGGGGGSGGGARVAALLRRLAREVTGAADLGALVGLLQRSSLAGTSG